MNIFYLIRHTMLAIAPSICYGRTDVEVGENYFSERDKIFSKINKLENENIIVHASPSLRCKKLANDYFPTVQIDERLMEMNFGNWENKSWAQIDKTAQDIWMNDFVNEKVPGGESFVDLYSRSKEFITDKIAENNNGIHIVFTHAGPIRSILCYALGLPLQHAFRLKIDYNSVSKISFSNNIFSIDYINL